METRIETFIDGRPFIWRVAGEFAWGEDGPLCQLDRDPLLPGLGPSGYRVVDLPPGCAGLTRQRIAAFLKREGIERLESYHRQVDDAEHLRIIGKTRELRFEDLGIDPRDFTGPFEEALGVSLSEFLPMLGRDHVQLRINRPQSADYNPPHRDGSLPIWAKALNVWMPIAGVDSLTSLPVVPGSHCLAESECWQTRPGGTAIGGRPYRVPAIALFRHGRLEMIRPPLEFGQALLFTPYLIHGLAVNQSDDRTRMALELRFQIIDR